MEAEGKIIYPLPGNEECTVQLIQSVGSDRMILNAARISFYGDTRDEVMTPADVKLLRYLLKEGHGSPFEHNLLTFRVVCPIFVDRQWVRHRVGVSKNEVSGRYKVLKPLHFTPEKFRKQAPVNRQASVEDDGELNQEAARKAWESAWQYAHATYLYLLEIGVAREEARGVLPLCLLTENYYTFNVRSLLHFLHLRDHPGAQHETQLYARALAELAEPLFPETFKAWRELHADHA